MPKAGKTYGPRIPAPNYPQIKKDAEAQVLKELGLERPEDAVHVRPEDLIAKAAGILAQADAEVALHLNERDQALAHLWFYEQRLGLARTVGLGNMGYRQALATVMFGNKKHVHELPTGDGEELVQAAEAAGVERVENAEEKLLKTAPVVFAARARRDVAVRFMQEAVFALSEKPYGWKPEKIAEHAGVERNLIYKQRAAARRRRGL
ncbi:hypothetical protein ACF08W_28665 [Streptomyces sp. NPDC015144]|uniref:hypothetical protein n=1 Tax=Streptomyces sp. NPDC015144 TaxID=3364944 RepID=UPI0037012E8A